MSYNWFYLSVCFLLSSYWKTTLFFHLTSSKKIIPAAADFFLREGFCGIAGWTPNQLILKWIQTSDYKDYYFPPFFLPSIASQWTEKDTSLGTGGRGSCNTWLKSTTSSLGKKRFPPTLAFVYRFGFCDPPPNPKSCSTLCSASAVFQRIEWTEWKKKK